MLSTVSGGIDNFSDKAGMKRWNEIGAVVQRGWDKVVDAIEEVISTPDVDGTASAKAKAELEEPRDDEEDEEDEEDDNKDEADEADKEDKEDDDTDTQEDDEAATPVHDIVLGADEDFWVKVGIDPIRMMTSSGTFYTLRCYLDDVPIFLGRNGRISVFGSERSLARYLADEHDHDLSDLATYDDIRTAANDGSLRVEVTDHNVYVLSGLADDLADGPDAVDREQLELAVELLRDVGEYSDDSTVDEQLERGTPLGNLVAYVLDPDGERKPKPPYAKAVEKWGEIETFVESRLRQE